MVKPTKVDPLRRRDAEGDKLARVRQVDREDRAEFYTGIEETHARRLVEHLLEEAFREAGLDDLAADRRARDIADEIEDVYRRRLTAGRGALLRSTSGGLAKRGHYRVDPVRIRSALAEKLAANPGLSVTDARKYVAAKSVELFAEPLSVETVKIHTKGVRRPR